MTRACLIPAIASSTWWTARSSRTPAGDSASGRGDAEDAFGIAVAEFLALLPGQRRRIDPLRRRCGGLVRIIDGPHDIVDADAVDAVAQRQLILDAAGGDRKIAAEILARQELLRAASTGRIAHVIKAPQPERHRLAHVSDHDAQFLEPVQR